MSATTHYVTPMHHCVVFPADAILDSVGFVWNSFGGNQDAMHVLSL